MESFELNPLESKIIAPEQAMEGHLKLAEKDGVGRDAIARVLELESFIDANTAARWSVPARRTEVTRTTFGSTSRVGPLNKQVA